MPQTTVFKSEGRGVTQSAASWHLSQFTMACLLKDNMYFSPALYPHVCYPLSPQEDSQINYLYAANSALLCQREMKTLLL